MADSRTSMASVPVSNNEGRLSSQQSEATLERLRSGSNPADILKGNLTTMAAAGAGPLITGNRVSLLVDGEETFDAMLSAIEGAKNHVNLETYIFQNDEVGRLFADLLLRKRSQGVEVNLIYDSFGSRSTRNSFFDRLRAGGVNVVEFNPMTQLFNSHNTYGLSRRTHRKMLIVDGATAYVGGINIGNTYLRGRRHRGKPTMLVEDYWRDTHVMIEGPAAWEFQRLFITTWAEQGGPPLLRSDYFPKLEQCGDDVVQAVDSRPGYANRTTYVMYVSAIMHARHSIHLTHSYFAPDTLLLQALEDAANRGVDVRIILPKHTDHFSVRQAARWHYAQLLESGVRIFERSNTVLHAKTAVIDGVWSTVGSTNLELWSFATTDEVNAVILGSRFAAEMESLFKEDLDDSEEISRDEWKQRSLLDRTKEFFFNLLRYWM
jgi:cardiolipin synthase A/B